MTELFETGDGSHSLFHPQLDETYHSRHGAITESRHVFIQHGLHYVLTKAPEIRELRIFEVGFGTGLNAILCHLDSTWAGRTLQYHSVEAFPVPQELWSKLNYDQLLQAPKVVEKFHLAPWNSANEMAPGFWLTKLQGTLQEVAHAQYHLIFFDAFAPTKQPELWSLEVFEKMAAMLETGGVLVTYCAKGQVKRNLRAAGFTVEALAGPPGKREMIRAIKL